MADKPPPSQEPDSSRVPTRDARPQLSREQMERFVAVMRVAERRRRVLLVGYFLALAVMLGSVVGAFAAYVSLDGSRFRTLVFFAPFALTGSVLWYFGWRARQIRL